MHIASRVALPLSLSCLLTALPAQDPAPIDFADLAHHLVEVDLAESSALPRLIALDLDLVACHGLSAAQRHAEVIATDADLETLREAGLEFDVVIRNLEEHHAREAAKFGPFPDAPTPPLGQGAMGGHWTFAQAVAILDQLAAQNPAICAPKVSLGQTHEGRDVWMVKISDNVGVEENEPEVLFDALHHAREPLSMETTILFMTQLLDGYGTDPEITYLVNNREMFFVPIVNPDGYEYNRQIAPNGGGNWRVNRRPGGGVDLNRNYSSFWGMPGASGSPGSSQYRGPSAFSEPETSAIESLAQAHNFVQVCSAHAYTDVLLTPWGYQFAEPTTGFAPYVRVANIATAATGIAYGSFARLLGYLGSGTAVDYHHVEHSSLSWTPELGRSSEGGFWPNPTRTVNIATRHAPMLQKLALLSGPSLTDGEILMMSDGSLGSNARIGMLGHNSGQALLAVSGGTANLPVPGVNGNFLLDPATTIWLPPEVFDATGYRSFDFQIPNNGALSGGVVYWQMLHVINTNFTFGNRETLAIQ